MTRPHAFLLLVPAACLLALGACGGGASTAFTPPPSPKSDVSFTEVQQSAHVDLPAGSPWAPGDLRLANALGTVRVHASGDGACTIWEGAPLLTAALDPDGKVVLLGFLGPHTDTLTPRTTAVALLYLATAAFALPPDQDVGAPDALADEPLLDELVQAIGDAYAGGAANLEAARNAYGAALEDAARAVIERVQTQATTVDPGPQDSVSGLRVQSPVPEEIEITNFLRRRATAYLRTTGYVPASGQGFVDVDGHWTHYSLEPTTGFSSLVGTVLAFLSGSGLYTPTTKHLEVPFDPSDATATEYQVVAVGPGFSFGEAYSDLTFEQKDELARLYARSVLLDFALPLIANTILPFGKSWVQSAIGDPDVVATVLTGASVIVGELDLRAKIDAGDIRGLLLDTVKLVLENTKIKDALYKAFEDYLRAHGAKAGFQVTADALLSVTQIADAAGTSVDSLAQIASWAASDMADEWTVEVTSPNVNVSPRYTQRVEGTPAPEVTLEVSVQEPPPPGQFYHYAWTIEGNAGHLSTDGETSSGMDDTVEGTTPFALYTADAGKTGTDDVLVEVSYGEAPDRVVVGRAQATVEVVEFQPELLPDEVSVHPGEASDAFEVRFPGDPSTWPSPLYFVWSSDEVHGHLEGVPNGGFTTERTCTYRADPDVDTPADETIRVQVLTSEDGTQMPLGEATATVHVEEKKSIIFGDLIFHTKEFSDESGNARVAIAVIVRITFEPGAKSYTLHATGGDDPYYWGSEIDLGDGALETSEPVGLIEEGEYPDAFWFLSGGQGPAHGEADGLAYYHSRFDGFECKVTVTYDH